MACRQVRGAPADRFESRPAARARLFGARATGVERAPGRDVNRARGLAFDHRPDERDLVEARSRRQERGV